MTALVSVQEYSYRLREERNINYCFCNVYLCRVREFRNYTPSKYFYTSPNQFLSLFAINWEKFMFLYCVNFILNWIICTYIIVTDVYLLSWHRISLPSPVLNLVDVRHIKTHFFEIYQRAVSISFSFNKI